MRVLVTQAIMKAMVMGQDCPAKRAVQGLGLYHSVRGNEKTIRIYKDQQTDFMASLEKNNL